MKQDKSHLPHVRFPSDYVVEWYVENNPERYKRLTVGREVPRTREKVYDDSGRPQTKETITHAVLCVVMEVPLPELESVTSQIRTSINLKPADYLLNSAKHADASSELADRCLLLERHVLKLRDELIREGRRQDHGAHGLTDKGGPNEDRLARRIHEINALAFHETDKVREALAEKEASVAARLLLSLDDPYAGADEPDEDE